MGQKLEDMNEDSMNLQLKMKQMQEDHNEALRERRDAERKLQDENKELRKEIVSRVSPLRPQSVSKHAWTGQRN